VLHLPNVMHLATDVTGCSRTVGALGLAAALHPTAAVGGTPTALALEPSPTWSRCRAGATQGRSAGWTPQARGEWGLALRCGQLDGSRVRLFAGCGIVAGSQSDAELAEAQAKLVPMRDALGG
jgi:menaquinone-specific isochorismate synthase